MLDGVKHGPQSKVSQGRGMGRWDGRVLGRLGGTRKLAGSVAGIGEIRGLGCLFWGLEGLMS